MTVIKKKNRYDKCWRERGGIRTLMLVAHENRRCCSHLVEESGGSSIVQHRVMIKPSNSHPRCSHKRIEDMCPHETVHTNVHSNIFIIRQKVVTTKISINL